jgi:hypothetical protein
MPELTCSCVYDPGWIQYKHGTFTSILYGHWAALYRMMVKWDGEEKASNEFWGFFKNPAYTLAQLEKSAYLTPQISTRL